MRRLALNRLREHAIKVFDNRFKNEEFSPQFDRSNLLHFTEYLRFPGESSQFSQIPPLCFPDQVRRMKDVFRSEVLMKVSISYTSASES